MPISPFARLRATPAGTAAALLAGKSMTAPQIEEALLQTPPDERIAVAAKLIALALADEDLDDAGERLPEDRDALMTHLRDKLSR
jgi:hypothetical protein